MDFPRPLPEPEIRALIQSYRAGDLDSADKIIAANTRVIFVVARRHYNSGTSGDNQFEDLMQYGRIGMLRALQDFDMDRGVKFLSYAYYWVNQYVNRYGKYSGSKMSMSYRATEDRGKLGAARAMFIQENKREPSPADLKLATGMSTTKIQQLRMNVVSLDDMIEEDATLADVIADETDVENEVMDSMVDNRVMNAVNCLPGPWRIIIMRRYGLNGEPEESRKTVAKSLGITVSRIQQIETSALEKLRKILAEDL